MYKGILISFHIYKLGSKKQDNLEKNGHISSNNKTECLKGPYCHWAQAPLQHSLLIKN